MKPTLEMKVALITDGITPHVMGGMQRHSALLALHLAALGVEIHVFHTCRDSEQAKVARLHGENESRGLIHYYFVDYPEEGRLPGHYVRDLKKYSQKVYRHFVDLKLDVDFIYTQGLTGWAFLQVKLHGNAMPPIGVNCHGYEMYQWTAGVRGKIEQLLLRPSFKRVTRYADLVFSFDAKIKEIVTRGLGKSIDQVAIAPNAIDAGWLVSEPSPVRGARKFLFVGRYERRKGIPEIYQAIQSRPDLEYEFHFVGPIPERDQLNDPRLRYHGIINDEGVLKDVMGQCDVLLCPSYAEGMPTVILEAMSRGLAIIATDVGACSVMVGSDNGVLVDRCDSRLIAEAMHQMTTVSQDTMMKLKVASLNKVAQFSWDRVSRRILDVVSEHVS